MNDQKHTQAYEHLFHEYELFKKRNAPILEKGITLDQFVQLLVDEMIELYSSNTNYGGNLSLHQSEIVNLLIHKFGLVYKDFQTDFRLNKLNREDCIRMIQQLIPPDKHLIKFIKRWIGWTKDNDHSDRDINSIFEKLLNEFQQQATMVIVVNSDQFFQDVYNLLTQIDSLLAELTPTTSNLPVAAKQDILDKRILVSYHRVLGLLNSHLDQIDMVQEKKRLESLLAEFKISVLWPNPQKDKESSSEFIVFPDPQLQECVAYSPCFKQNECVIIQGEMGIPQNKESDTSSF